MNSVNLIGNLCKDPELKYTQGKGTAVSRVTLAVRRDKDNSDFITCVVWGKAAETLATYCSKGTKIGLEGSIRTGSYEGKDGKKVYTTEVHSLRIHLIEKKKEGQAGNSGEPNYDDMIPEEGDIPF